MANWYVNSVAYAAVAQWAALHVYTVGNIVRQLADPGYTSRRCFRCTTGGTSSAAEPSWSVNPGDFTTDGAGPLQWQEITGNETYQAPGAWAAPHQNLQCAYQNHATAGDIVYVSSNHNETNLSGVIVTSNTGSGAIPNYVICVDESASGHVPPQVADLKTGAKVGDNGGLTIDAQNDRAAAYFRGIEFSCSVGGNLSVGGQRVCTRLVFEKCILGADSAGGNFIRNNAGRTDVELIDTRVRFGNAAGALMLDGFGSLRWRDGSSAAIISPTYPSALMRSFNTNGAGSLIDLVGLDLTGLGANIIWDEANHQNCGSTFIRILDCKLDSNTVVANDAPGSQRSVDLVTSDSGASGNRQERYMGGGKLLTEKTIIRSLGANDSVAGFSWKINTTNSAGDGYPNWPSPFDAFPIAIWNSVIGVSRTATIEIVNDGVTLNNDDVWVELHYLASSASPIGGVVSSNRATVISSNAAIPTSTATWTTTGLGAPVKQKLQVSFTPQMVGFVYAHVRVAKASQVLYVDPLITLS